MADTKNPIMENGGMNLEIEESIAQGRYANLAIISHSTSEFIVDYAVHLPGLSTAKVHSRVILTPEHAKRLLNSLQDNIAKYEGNYGSIGRDTSSQSLDPLAILNASPKVGEA